MQPLLFINGYLRMEYTLFLDFTRKIPLPAPPTGRPGRTQSARIPEFDYRAPKINLLSNYITTVTDKYTNLFGIHDKFVAVFDYRLISSCYMQWEIEIDIAQVKFGLCVMCTRLAGGVTVPLFTIK